MATLRTMLQKVKMARHSDVYQWVIEIENAEKKLILNVAIPWNLLIFNPTMFYTPHH